MLRALKHLFVFEALRASARNRRLVVTGESMRKLALLALAFAAPLLARDYNTAPSLANPAGMTVVSVSSVGALQSAVSNIQNNQMIELADGTYSLTQSLFFNSAATSTRTNIGIRSASRNPAACIIQGAGMSGGIPHGIHVSRTSGMLIADLTIRLVANHAIQIAGETTVSNVQMYNLRLIDTGEQFIKGSTSGYQGGSDSGLVEYCLMSYTTQGTTYTNGVDIHGGDGWIIRHNRFERVNVIPGGIGPAVLMWNGSSNTICEANTFINCETAIAFGLSDRAAPQTDHSGGVIRNNFIYRAPGTPSGVDSPDCSILVWDSPNTKVLNNTVIQSGTYANAIEYRFSTTGAEIRFNLCDGAIFDRGGGTGANTVAGNVINAQSGWFTAAASGNLRLSAGAPASVVDAAATHASVTSDYDGYARPAGAAPDIGGSERGGAAAAPPSAPANLIAVANQSLGIDLTWTDASTNEDGFRVERSVAGGAFSARVSLPAGSASYADTGLIEGTQYNYRVIAFNTAGDSAPGNSAGTTASQSPASGSSGGSSGGSGGCSATFGGSGLLAMASLLFFTLTLKRRKLS